MKHIFTLLFACIGIISLAQNGSVSGQIISEDGITLPGAVVRVGDTSLATVSDNDGNYRIIQIPDGEYTLKVSYIGFADQAASIGIQNNTIAQNFTLAPNNNLGEAIVVGQNLQGISRALNQQKNSDNITNVVSADQMGRFPDANIGDAMKRIPGVTMQNDQGEARNIFIRGIAPQYNSVTLNGDRIPSAEGDNRNVQMDLIPTDMIQLVEVNKALLPEMDGDAIGGSVNLVTRTATSEPRLSATFAPGYSPIRDNANWTGGLIAGKRFANDKLGVVFSSSYNRKDYGSDNFEAEYTYDDNEADAYMAEFQIRRYDVTRRRLSGGLDLDYKFSPNHTIRLKTLISDRKDWENRFRVSYRDIESDGFIGEIRRETKGGINNNDIKNRRLEHQQTNKFGLDGNHLFGNIELDWSASYSDASEKRPNERYLIYRIKDVEGTMSGLGTKNPLITSNSDLTADDYEFKEMTEEFQDTKEENMKLKLDLKIPVSKGVNKSHVKVGTSYKDKTKNRNNQFFEYSDDDIEDAYTLLSSANAKDFTPNHYQPGNQYKAGVFADTEFLGNINTANFNGESVLAEFLPANYNANENVFAGYVQYKQNFGEKWKVIVGSRYESTTLDYQGNELIIPTEGEEDNGADVSYEETTGKSDYSNLLPSVHINYSPTNQSKIRVAWTNSMARPNYYDLVPYRFFDEDEVLVGNPNLEAAEASNLDVIGELYFENIGLVSLGGFYKNIDNFFYNYNNDEYTVPGRDIEFDYTQPRNGSNAKVFGFEASLQRQLDFLPGILGRFNFYGNYTYTGSEATINERAGENLKLTGTAPHLLNASLGYEDRRFNSRLSFNYTSDYVDEYGDEAFEDIYYDQQGFIDLNANYFLKENWTIFFEGKNLTNQPLRYYQGNEVQTYQVEYYRPTYNLGVKYDF